MGPATFTSMPKGKVVEVRLSKYLSLDSCKQIAYRSSTGLWLKMSSSQVAGLKTTMAN